jgi:hypothetical protein
VVIKKKKDFRYEKWQIMVVLCIVWDLIVLSNPQRSDTFSLISFTILIPLILFWMYCIYVIFFIDWEDFYVNSSWAFVALSPCVLYVIAHGLAFIFGIFFLIKSVFN